MNPILVPVDFSPISRVVLAEAITFARLTSHPIALLHVVQPPTVMSDYGPLLENIVQYTAHAEKGAERQLARLKAKLLEEGIAAQTLLRTGSPLKHILDEARKTDASYIVIGSHGHTASYDLLVGSTTSGVLKRASCPVLVVPATKPAKKTPSKR